MWKITHLIFKIQKWRIFKSERHQSKFFINSFKIRGHSLTRKHDKVAFWDFAKCNGLRSTQSSDTLLDDFDPNVILSIHWNAQLYDKVLFRDDNDQVIGAAGDRDHLYQPDWDIVWKCDLIKVIFRRSYLKLDF